jgi:hypothetical protein
MTSSTAGQFDAHGDRDSAAVDAAVADFDLADLWA